MIRQHLEDSAKTFADFVWIFRRHPFQGRYATRACRDRGRKICGVLRKQADCSWCGWNDKFLMQVLATQAT
ncbi:MAG: hypothetical protein DWI00_16690 [Planctomycetota bacterium]|nr:MAG: hypothetical protein DWI00_16690 [Planctomycetota bacterium]